VGFSRTDGVSRPCSIGSSFASTVVWVGRVDARGSAAVTSRPCSVRFSRAGCGSGVIQLWVGHRLHGARLWFAHDTG
jgi:hypothetical protein